MMTTPAKRATVYFEPDIHKALKLKSIETSKSISELVNTAVKEALAEDAEDITAYEERADEPLISFAEMLKRLRNDGRI
ncbi:MAG: CopG family transcriptional regulator [Desulfobacterales bacterium]|nr:CopG family transcriptional regulator [Desulfobacterales bacterium]